ncbi:MAG: UDP-2,3-diacylglucosamine diphosphatase [Flavobacteriales bacterium]|nr:UDP-2,3-diacylglucosamine diphosphatase [Flavobacteriales bacterium]MCB9192108.1 UDP-2,3-diacylglucosamine diphosphatase [Flavobacteriales bacterium]
MSTASKNIYFASDFHLGVPDKEASKVREKLLIHWLDSIADTAEEIYLVGDIFDFWYEYGKVIPKGFVRFQAKLAELCDKGIPIHIFIGNHDMWMFSYFEEELGVQMHREPITREWNGKKFYIGHGDGLGPGDYSYKFIKKVFANPLCIWLFKWLHPDIGMALANFWSGKSRESNSESDQTYYGDENEWLLQYSKTVLKEEHFDYFIFGHRHLVLDKEIGENSRYINLGAWFKDPHFAVWDGENLSLQKVTD